jgi:PAS domain S-box-containing protein
MSNKSSAINTTLASSHHSIRPADESKFISLANNMSNLAWMADVNGWIYWYNDRWYEYTGTQPVDMEGWGWQSVHDPIELPNVLKRWQASIESGKSFDMVFPIKGADGVFRSFLTRVEPSKDEQGVVTGWLGTNTDVDSIVRTSRIKEQLEHKTSILEEQRQHLIKINQAKDEFISLASHQLRTPATSVMQYIGMLQAGYAGELTVQQKDFVDRAYNSNERLLKTVDDLLKVAVLDAGKITPKITQVELAPLIHDIIASQAGIFAHKQQDVSFEPGTDAFTVKADPELLRMAVENITSNASKYTKNCKKITLKLVRAEAQIHIKICDQGVGIPEEQIKDLFKKFKRIHNELSIAVGGSGLGLYWVKKVIELHKGKIEVTSKYGQGSTFTIILPA